MNTSVWSQNTELPAFEKLRGNKSTDVLIIGGGLCGLLCAYFLDKEGVDYVLLEGDRIASGTTKNTTAKITFQHGLIYDKLIKDFGPDMAQRYLTANRRALEKYVSLCGDIDCGFERADNYIYSENDLASLEAEVDAVNRLGFEARLVKETELPFEVAGAVYFPGQARFDPLKFAANIAKELKIYEHTMVRDIGPEGALLKDGSVTAKKIIVATHFPFINRHGGYFLRLYQQRSYVLGLEGAPKMEGMYLDAAENGLSFRSCGDLLLLGGGGHRTGKKGGNWQELKNFTAKYYPEAKIKYAWAAQDCMSLDGIPYIGNYSGKTHDMYVATGFNKWGMTSSMAAAQILTDMVLGRDNDCAPAFSPQRSSIKPQLFVNGLEATVNLLTPTPRRCPHMGCALKWNKAEHSWDCPCHGSRFTSEGKLIDNPATGDAKV